MSESRSRYLKKNTLLFALGNIGSKIISFFLIPLYTNVLTTSQYGIVDLIINISIVITPVLTLNIGESVMRFGLDKDSDKEKNIQIGTFIFCVAALVGLLLLPVCGMIEQISEYSFYIYCYIISSAASQIYMCDLRGKELLLQYSIGNLISIFFTAILNIVFLLVLNMGIHGYFMAYIISNIITALYALIVSKAYQSFKFAQIDILQMKKMIQYSVVLIPNSFMWWIMNSSDHFMVTGMIDVAANGIYAVSYKLPNIISILANVFNQAWSYSAIREDGADDEEEYNNKVLKTLTSTSMLIGIGMLTIIRPLLKIYIAPEYFEAWKYTPFLIIGCVYMTLGTFMAASYTVHKDSFGYLFSASFGAACNVVLNLLLIPMIGVYGAAFATCISYIAVFAFRLIHTRKYIKYNLINKEFIIGSIIMICSSFIMYLDKAIISQAVQLILLVVAINIYSNVWKPFIIKMAKNRREKNI